ncbi:MAG: PASTA domain-containing protein [Firmicutes bacterium]|nr:PASTA domain-containing protein [Bacillota bacterium]
MKKMSKFTARTLALLLVFLGCFGFLAVRVLSIKAVHGEDYEFRAKAQQVNRYDRVLVPNRGMIVDRNNQTLAVSTTVYNIVLDPIVLSQNSEKEQQKTINALSEKLGLSATELAGYIAIDPTTGAPYRNNNWTVLKKKVSRELTEELMEMELKGVVYEKDSERRYPLNTVAANVLGFMRGDSAWGLESRYNEELSGVAGRSFMTYNEEGSVITNEIKAQDGSTLVTTLDYTLQEYAQNLAREAYNSYNAENTAVMIMDPYTGEILAMAQGKTFDPNDPANPILLTEGNEAFKIVWDLYSNEQQLEYLNSVWNNYCVASTFEPGSVFKPVTVAMALEEGIISKDEIFFCPGSKIVYDYDIGCWNESGHGSLNLEEAIAQSCNVALMDIAEKIGAKTFYKYQRDFGFGSKTGIDLPAESSGILFPENKIGPVDLATMSFGQSFNCTTVQIMAAAAAVINGGELLQPYVVSEIVDANGNIVYKKEKTVIRKVISQETSDILREYMISTMESGTGTKAAVPGYTIGGKTGTGQQGKREDWIHSLDFFCFLPADKPQYLAFVMVDKVLEYENGVTSVAPVMKSLLENIIKYKGIFPDKEGAEFIVQNESVNRVNVGEYAGTFLGDAANALNRLGLEYEVIGVGNYVTEQVPLPGTPVDEGSTIILYVQNDGDDGDKLVPNVLGMDHNTAIDTIINSGLSPVLTGDNSGEVISQSPNHGIALHDGDEVTIRLKAPPEETEAPATE